MRPIPAIGYGRRWTVMAGVVTMALWMILGAGCKSTPDQPTGADYPYEGPIVMPDGRTPTIPGGTP
jgi:hypothetical protein